MSMKTLYICKTKLFLILSIICLFLGGILLAFPVKVSADFSTSAYLSLPKTELEYSSLDSPKDVYYEDGLIAINDNGKKLLISKNNSQLETALSPDNLGLIKYFDQNYLLVSNSGSIYKFDRTNYSLTALKDSQTGLNIGSNFDYNGNLLITNDNTTAIIYSINGDSAEKIKDFSTYAKSPVAINKAGEIFYVNIDGNLCVKSSDGLVDKVIILGTIPTKIIANNAFAYFITSDSIYQYSIQNGIATKLTVSQNNLDFELGNVVSPTGICFKGDNLLITDASDSPTSINAVQEFSVNGSELEFTGFAIAKNKTAFNRISKSAKDIENYENTYAVLDSNKITINRNGTFYNILLKNHSDLIVDMFSLGKDTVLISNSSSGKYKIINIKDNLVVSSGTIDGGLLMDVCYQDGYYYSCSITLNTLGTMTINKLDENGNKYLSFSEDNFYDGSPYPVLCVDVDQNVYVTNTKENLLYKFDKNGQNKSSIQGDILDVKKMAIDLNGKIYMLKTGGIFVSYEQDKEEISISNFSGSFTSFSLSYSNKNVYFIENNEERIYSSTTMQNASIDDIAVPDNFTKTGDNADISSLKIFKPKGTINSFKVLEGDTYFKYEGKIEQESEYFLIASIDYTGGSNMASTNYFVLGGKQLVIIKSSSLEEITTQKITDIDDKNVFVTTSVSPYFMPQITRDDEYVINSQSLSRLNKGDHVKAEKLVNFLGKDFYYANIIDDKYAYVPVDFTVDVLREDIYLQSFSVKKVHKTNLYADQEKLSLLEELAEGTEIMLLQNLNRITKIALKVDNDYIVGYVDSSAVIEEPSTALRNAIIIFVVSLSMFATSLYLIFKKKNLG